MSKWRQVTVAEVPCWCYDRGVTKPHVVVVPGLWYGAEFWKSWANKAGPSVTVIDFRALPQADRGYDSDRAHIIRVLSSLGRDNDLIVLGQSFRYHVLLEALSMAPPGLRIAYVGLVNAGLPPWNKLLWLLIRMQYSYARKGENYVRHPARPSEKILRVMGLAENSLAVDEPFHLVHDVFRHAFFAWKRGFPMAGALYPSDDCRLDWEGAPQQLCPVHVWYTRHDDLIPRPSGEWVAKVLGGADLNLLMEVMWGHGGCIRIPDDSVSVEGFLRKRITFVQ